MSKLVHRGLARVALLASLAVMALLAPTVFGSPIYGDHGPEESHDSAVSAHAPEESHASVLSEHRDSGSHSAVYSDHTDDLSHASVLSEHLDSGSHAAAFSDHREEQSHASALSEHSSGPHHQDSGEAKIRESTAGVSRKPSSDGKACGCSSKHLCGLTAWNT